MGLLRPLQQNTNNNTAAPAQQQVMVYSEPRQQQPAQINWPKTQVKSNGNGYVNQNRCSGQFVGTLKALRPIVSQKDPTVFAVIDIAVPGKVGVFQDFLHFNEQKAEASMSFLVNRVKAIMASAGAGEEEESEHDIAWVQNILQELIAGQAQVKFIQEHVARGLDIQYI